MGHPTPQPRQQSDRLRPRERRRLAAEVLQRVYSSDGTSLLEVDPGLLPEVVLVSTLRRPGESVPEGLDSLHLEVVLDLILDRVVVTTAHLAELVRKVGSLEEDHAVHEVLNRMLLHPAATPETFGELVQNAWLQSLEWEPGELLTPSQATAVSLMEHHGLQARTVSWIVRALDGEPPCVLEAFSALARDAEMEDVLSALRPGGSSGPTDEEYLARALHMARLVS